MSKLTPAQKEVMARIDEGWVLKIPWWNSSRAGLRKYAYLTKPGEGGYEVVHATTAKNVAIRLNHIGKDGAYYTYGRY